MKLQQLHLSDVVAIPGALDVSGGVPVKREQSFHADDGWDLREVLPGVFSISRADMPHAVTVGGVGYSYVPMPPEETLKGGGGEAFERQVDAFREAGQRLVAINEHAMQGVHSQSALVTGNAAQTAYAQQYHRKGKR